MNTKKKGKEKTHYSRVITLDKKTTDELKRYADGSKRSLKNYIELKLTELATESYIYP